MEEDDVQHEQEEEHEPKEQGQLEEGVEEYESIGKKRRSKVRGRAGRAVAGEDLEKEEDA